MALKGTGLGTPNMYDNHQSIQCFTATCWHSRDHEREEVPDMDIVILFPRGSLARTFEMTCCTPGIAFVIASTI